MNAGPYVLDNVFSLSPKSLRGAHRVPDLPERLWLQDRSRRAPGSVPEAERVRGSAAASAPVWEALWPVSLWVSERTSPPVSRRRNVTPGESTRGPTQAANLGTSLLARKCVLSAENWEEEAGRDRDERDWKGEGRKRRETDWKKNESEESERGHQMLTPIPSPSSMGNTGVTRTLP